MRAMCVMCVTHSGYVFVVGLLSVGESLHGQTLGTPTPAVVWYASWHLFGVTKYLRHCLYTTNLRMI